MNRRSFLASVPVVVVAAKAIATEEPVRAHVEAWESMDGANPVLLYNGSIEDGELTAEIDGRTVRLRRGLTWTSLPPLPPGADRLAIYGARR